MKNFTQFAGYDIIRQQRHLALINEMIGIYGIRRTKKTPGNAGVKKEK